MKSEKIFSMTAITQILVVLLAQLALTLRDISSGEKLGLELLLRFIPTITGFYVIHLLRHRLQMLVILVAASTIVAALIFGIECYGSGGIYWGLIPIVMASIAFMGFSTFSYHYLTGRRKTITR